MECTVHWMVALSLQTSVTITLYGGIGLVGPICLCCMDVIIVVKDQDQRIHFY